MSKMSDFKRSPSKVWWSNESFESRQNSDSRCSQDSGFSDAELPGKKTVLNHSKKNTKELIEQKNHSRSCPLTRSGRVNKNLFITHDRKHAKDVLNHQYSEAVLDEATHSNTSSNDSCILAAKQKEISYENGNFPDNYSLSSDCESELEELFREKLQHTSTPKSKSQAKMLFSKRYLPIKIRASNNSAYVEKNKALSQWYTEIKYHCEQECTTTLHSKSILGELHQKVAIQAASIITRTRSILLDADRIENEYKKLLGMNEAMPPLAQSLVGNIVDFLRKYCSSLNHDEKYIPYELIKQSYVSNLPQLTSFFEKWKSIHYKILSKEVSILLEKLENPKSDLNLRAIVTGITSLCVEDENLINIFTNCGIIPILIILCEKCEGSSIRCLLLRAITTMCASNLALEHMEKFSGLEVIKDTFCQDFIRPEPERSEAVSLLVQLTAPWREGDLYIKCLGDYTQTLIYGLTTFLTSTKCCQNILLCVAALANLTEIDQNCTTYMLESNTIKNLLEVVKKRGPCVSIYLFEQVASLVVNLTTNSLARKQLARTCIVQALLHFLKIRNVGEDVEKRLQQKSVIALSRLSSEAEICLQIVELGGIQKLVKMCREKNERYSSDAVLVATLATLRKIVEVCGKKVMNAEDIQELVAPKLLDSFLAYSTQNESYV